MKPVEHIPEPEPAATLVLVRENQERLEVYLIKRSSQSGFMAGMYVFPGGTVDQSDYDTRLWKHRSSSAERQIGHLLAEDMPVSNAAAYASAAIRECLEEAGVFLAQTDSQHTQKLQRITWQAQSSERESGWFNHAVRTDEWLLDMGALQTWSHWITPPQMKRRYDTRFFLGTMPSGQSCRPDGHESTDGVWVTPAEALRKNLVGRLPLSPPTLVTLQQILSYERIDDLFRAAGSRGWGDPITPRLVTFETGALILEPWDPEYHQAEIEICKKDLESTILEAGEQFSRIWYSKGLWRPVSVR